MCGSNILQSLKISENISLEMSAKYFGYGGVENDDGSIRGCIQTVTYEATDGDAEWREDDPANVAAWQDVRCPAVPRAGHADRHRRRRVFSG